MSILCGSDGSCPFLYQCISNKCHHKPIFPLTNYEYGIFSLFPICSAICNLSGNSFGEFKVLMLMDLLNYQENEATVLAYPLIVGTALFNFIDLIFKRHPTRNTSLIDFNVVLIIIPNILFGSTIGSLVNNFIPPIVADSLIIPIMIGFSIKFFLRFRDLQKKELEKEAELLKDASTLDKKQPQIQLSNVDSSSQRESENRRQSESDTQSNRGNNIVLLENQLTIQLTTAQNKQELEKLQKYQAGYHFPHVLVTILIFMVFETLSFLVQGKIIPFSICSHYYPIGMTVLTILFILFDLVMFRYTVYRIRYYKEVGYEYDAPINFPKNFLLICFGAFLGGFNGGVFGIGNSTTVIFTLLFLKMDPVIVSATVGYQVVFAGSASLAQAYVTNSIAGNVALLLFLETFIMGGILSLIGKKIVSRLSPLKVNKMLVLIIFSLVTCSIFALIISIVLGYLQFGAQNMQEVPFDC